MRHTATIIGAVTCVLLAACGSGQSITAMIELHVPPSGSEDVPGMACSATQASDLSTGSEVRLQDESGAILGRVEVPTGRLIKEYDCQVDLVFDKVFGGAKMYALATTANKGWRLKPSEIIPGPATIDEANVMNFPQPL